MGANDLKERLREEYLYNQEIMDTYLRNQREFDDIYLRARKRNSEIVEYLNKVLKMDYDTIMNYLKEN